MTTGTLLFFYQDTQSIGIIGRLEQWQRLITLIVSLITLFVALVAIWLSSKLSEQNQKFLEKQQHDMKNFLELTQKMDRIDKHFHCVFQKALTPLQTLQRMPISDKEKLEHYKRTCSHLDNLIDKYYGNT